MVEPPISRVKAGAYVCGRSVKHGLNVQTAKVLQRMGAARGPTFEAVVQWEAHCWLRVGQDGATRSRLPGKAMTINQKCEALCIVDDVLRGGRATTVRRARTGTRGHTAVHGPWT